MVFAHLCGISPLNIKIHSTMENKTLEIKELTRNESLVMQVIWSMGSVYTHDILENIAEPKPTPNTIATVLRVLYEKKLIAYRTIGRNHQYYPLKEYIPIFMGRIVDTFFDGNIAKAFSFFIENAKNVTEEELDAVIESAKLKKDLL